MSKQEKALSVTLDLSSDQVNDLRALADELIEREPEQTYKHALGKALRRSLARQETDKMDRDVLHALFRLSHGSTWRDAGIKHDTFTTMLVVFTLGYAVENFETARNVLLQTAPVVFRDETSAQIMREAKQMLLELGIPEERIAEWAAMSAFKTEV